MTFEFLEGLQLKGIRPKCLGLRNADFLENLSKGGIKPGLLESGLPAGTARSLSTPVSSLLEPVFHIMVPVFRPFPSGEQLRGH